MLRPTGLGRARPARGFRPPQFQERGHAAAGLGAEPGGLLVRGWRGENTLASSCLPPRR